MTKIGSIQGTGIYQDDSGAVWASNWDLSVPINADDSSIKPKCCLFFHDDDPVEFCTELQIILQNVVKSCK